MAIVAVAGGTGNVGRVIVEALVKTNKHKIIILSRSSNPALETELGVPIIAVDYSNVEAVTQTLEENHVDTVISAIMMMPGPTGEPKEIQLIQAADASKTTKRMISSDYGIAHSEGHAEKLPSVKYKQQAQEFLKTVKNLETTWILNGQFTDFWGIPGVKSPFHPLPVSVDIANDTACIPGDGNAPIIMTHTSDVGKFVAASLDLEKWAPVYHIVGDKASINDILRYAEEVKGKKFTVMHDSVEQLRQGKASELPGQIVAYGKMPKEVLIGIMATFSLWFAEGVFDYKVENSLNDEFPEIKPLTVKALIEQAWSKA